MPYPRSIAAALLFAAGGCAPENTLSPQKAPEEEALPSPYLAEETDTTDVVVLSPDQVQVGIESVLSEMLGLDPSLIFDAQDEAFAAGDGECPLVYDTYVTLYGYYYWYATCEASNGASFDGYAYYNRMYEVDYGTYTYKDYGYFYGLTDIRTADGQRYEQTGSAYFYDIDYYASANRYLAWTVAGDFIWTGEDHEDDWLGADVSMQMNGYTYQYDSGATLMYVNGTLGGLDGEFDSASFNKVFAMDAAMGNTCPEPGGTISIRDGSTGEWYDVDFQGPKYWGAGTFPPDCDGCGSVYHRGEYLGQACPNLDGMLTWEGRPWR